MPRTDSSTVGSRGSGDRQAGLVGRERSEGPGARGRLGWYRATDGSRGAPVDVDLDRPHAGLVVGKRGSGKSYTLGVLAEELAAANGVAPVLVDPMGEFSTLADGVPARVVERPQVPAAALDARGWCTMLDLEPTSAVGGLVWRAATAVDTLGEMREAIADSTADAAVARAADNHLAMAASWDVFDPDGLAVSTLGDERATVLDLSGASRAATGAVLNAVATELYDAAVGDDRGPLPWLLVDEAAALVDGVAAPALRTLLTRGRSPGVSLVLATQRPGALPDVAISQSDLLIAHRLTAESDVRALARARPTYLRNSLEERLPSEAGVALVVDESTEDAVTVRVRERESPHGGTTPRATDRTDSDVLERSAGASELGETSEGGTSRAVGGRS